MALNDFRSVIQVLFKVQPDEIYHLAGQSSVSLSFQQPVETQESVYVATLNLLEAIRFTGKKIRFIMRVPASASGTRMASPPMRKHRSGPGAPTRWQSRRLSGKSPITGKLMAYTPVRAFCLIMNLPFVRNDLSPKKLSRRLPNRRGKATEDHTRQYHYSARLQAWVETKIQNGGCGQDDGSSMPGRSSVSVRGAFGDPNATQEHTLSELFDIYDPTRPLLAH